MIITQIVVLQQMSSWLHTEFFSSKIQSESAFRKTLALRLLEIKYFYIILQWGEGGGVAWMEDWGGGDGGNGGGGGGGFPNQMPNNCVNGGWTSFHIDSHCLLKKLHQ
jgi:hypothetical protein